MNPFSKNDGVTVGIINDRYPATVIKTTPKSVVVQLDHYTYDKTQGWVFTPNTEGKTFKFLMRAEGAWTSKKNILYLSKGRGFYLNPSF